MSAHSFRCALALLMAPLTVCASTFVGHQVGLGHGFLTRELEPPQAPNYPDQPAILFSAHTQQSDLLEYNSTLWLSTGTRADVAHLHPAPTWSPTPLFDSQQPSNLLHILAAHHFREHMNALNSLLFIAHCRSIVKEWYDGYAISLSSNTFVDEEQPTTPFSLLHALLRWLAHPVILTANYYTKFCRLSLILKAYLHSSWNWGLKPSGHKAPPFSAHGYELLLCVLSPVHTTRMIFRSMWAMLCLSARPVTQPATYTMLELPHIFLYAISHFMAQIHYCFNEAWYIVTYELPLAARQVMCLAIYHLAPTLLFSAAITDWAFHLTTCHCAFRSISTAIFLPLSSLLIAITTRNAHLLPDGVDALLLLLSLIPITVVAARIVAGALRRAAYRILLLSRLLATIPRFLLKRRRALFGAVIMYSICFAAAAGGDDTSNIQSRPTFDGTRPGYISFRIALAGWLAWKDPAVAVHASKSPASAPPVTAPPDVLEKWDRDNIKLYGAILACVPDWLKTTLFIGSSNDGLKALAHLEKEYGSSDPNDRASAVTRATAKYIDPKSNLSEDDLRYTTHDICSRQRQTSEHESRGRGVARITARCSRRLSPPRQRAML